MPRGEVKSETGVTEDSSVKLEKTKSEEIKKRNKLLKFFIKATEKVIIIKEFINKSSQEKSESRNTRKMEQAKTILPVFDGSDYSIWKKRLLFFLRMKKCEDVIKRQKTRDDNA